MYEAVAHLIRFTWHFLSISFYVFVEPDGFDFMVVSLDNCTWHFEAQTLEVNAIHAFCDTC